MNARPRPYVVLKAALSLDGYWDDRSAPSRVFSGPEDRAAVDTLRAESDAILVGAGTLRSDNARLRVRSSAACEERLLRGLPKQPRRITITRSGRLKKDLAFFEPDDGDSELPIVFCARTAESALNAELSGRSEFIRLPANDADVCAFILEELHRLGVRSLLIEGGPKVFEQFLNDGQADKIRFAYASTLLCREGGVSFEQCKASLQDYTLSSVEKLGEMHVMSYLRSL